MVRKRMLALLFLLSLSLVFFIYGDVQFAISIFEHQKGVSNDFTITMNDTDTYYDTISLNAGAKSFSITINNRGDMPVYYDILFHSKIEQIELTSDGMTKIIEPEVTSVFLMETTAVDIASQKTYNFTIENDIPAMSLEVVCAYRIAYEKAGVSVDYTNKYIESEYDLRKILDSFSLNNEDVTKNNYARFFFLKEVLIEKPLNINIPCTIDLLYTNVEIASDLTLNHHYYGTYYMQSIEGKFINDAADIIIETPNAFVRIVDFDPSSIVSRVAGFVDIYDGQSSDGKIQLLKLAALDYLESLFLTTYIPEFQPGVVYYSFIEDIALPKTFFNYPIRYTYTTGNGLMTDEGHIIRSTSSEYDILNANAYFGDETTPTSESFPIVVVGTSTISVFLQTVHNLKEFFYRTFDDQGKYSSPIKLPDSLPFVGNLHYSFEDDSCLLVTEDNLIDEAYKVFSGRTEILEVEDDYGNIRTIDIPIRGMTIAERKAIVESYINPLVFGEENVMVPLFSNELYTLFGVKDVTYSIAMYDENGEVLADSPRYDLIVDKIEIHKNVDGDWLGLSIKFLRFLGLADDEYLRVRAHITWEDDTTSNHEVRMIIPDGGGSDGSEEEVFPYLLAETFALNGYTVDDFNVMSFYKTSTIALTVIDQELVPWITVNYDAVAKEYIIHIDREGIPRNNTRIIFKAIFEFNTTGNTVEQNYTIVVPGIYRCAPEYVNFDFADVNLYNELIRLTKPADPSYSDTSAMNNLLMQDEIESKSFENLNLSNLGITNLKGLENITTIQNLDISNNQLVGADKLAPLRNMLLNSLDMTNTNMDNESLSIMSTLIELTTLRASRNHIHTLKNSAGNSYFYRAVRVLDISSQYSDFTSLDGIIDTPYLVELNISNNKIARFEELLDLVYLREVYLGNNTPLSTTAVVFRSNGTPYNFLGAYGTDGNLNIVYYVSLIDKDVKVYKNVQMEYGVHLSEHDVKEARVLNSILYSNNIGLASAGSYDIVFLHRELINNGVKLYDLHVSYGSGAHTIVNGAIPNTQVIKVTSIGTWYFYLSVTYAGTPTSSVYRMITVKLWNT